jgi:large subunit ribosomal protein L15
VSAKKAEAKKTVRIRQVRSGIGCPIEMREIFKALGLGKMHCVAERADTKEVRQRRSRRSEAPRRSRRQDHNGTQQSETERARHAKKRVGRGPGSGHGKTAARGEKGQKSRSGFSRQPGFEGGQMPLHRRLPKRGFTNIFKKEYAVVNLSDLERFDNGATVDEAALRQAGLVKGQNDGVKVLGNGKLSKKLTVSATKFSATAKQAIEAAGGSVQEIQ